MAPRRTSNEWCVLVAVGDQPRVQALAPEARAERVRRAVESALVQAEQLPGAAGHVQRQAGMRSIFDSVLASPPAAARTVKPPAAPVTP